MRWNSIRLESPLPRLSLPLAMSSGRTPERAGRTRPVRGGDAEPMDTVRERLKDETERRQDSGRARPGGGKLAAATPKLAASTTTSG